MEPLAVPDHDPAEAADDLGMGAPIRRLYTAMIDGWNVRDAAAYAAPLAEDATVVGFDGSVHAGRAAIAADMRAIFASHQTGRYVPLVRSVVEPVPGTAILHATVGMVPAGTDGIRPELNAQHSVVAVRRSGTWRIVLFQNTPAAFHGRPDLAEALTAELRQAAG